MNHFKTKSHRCRVELLAVLAAGLVGITVAGLLEPDVVRNIYLNDMKNIVFNAAIVLVFAAGVLKLLQAFSHYDFEEKQLAEFIRYMQSGRDTEEAFPPVSSNAIIFRRYEEIKDLFHRRVSIHHGAFSAITVAEQGAFLTIPRFINNVLILTGVFGTIVSLIFALVGATQTLTAIVPTEGMAIMLAGMNTALTTTATAITCFFVFSYFFGKLSDLQTHLLSGIERAVLIHIIPRFTYDNEAINHETALLIRKLKTLIIEMQKGTHFISEHLSGFGAYHARLLEKLDAIFQVGASQLEATGQMIEEENKTQRILTEGFRLKP